MLFADHFNNRVALTDYLSNQLNLGRLSIVLGAGLSIPFKLPDWDNLLDRMYKGSSMIRDTGETTLIQAEHLKTHKYRGDEKEFLRCVHDALYRDCDLSFKKLQENQTLNAIGALVMASVRGNVGEIVTFNYDNILELYLSYHGFVCSAVCNPHFWRDRTDIRIFHPHGFLPHNEFGSFSESIVLDQESYSKTIGDASSVWFQTTMGVIRHKTCLFIGLSGNDGNLDSLMNTNKTQHPTSVEMVPYWAITLGKNFSEAKQTIWQNRGVFPMVVADYEHDLPSFLFNICQRAAQLR